MPWTVHSTRRPAVRPAPQVEANRRILSTYLGVPCRHGLWLDELAEPLPEPDWDPAHDADRKSVYLAAGLVKAPETWPDPARKVVGSGEIPPRRPITTPPCLRRW
jgi:hypothetical protein